nr:LuxR C-terminal-related transcriptional regulator [Gracilibacillus alcaliphilus]
MHIPKSRAALVERTRLFHRLDKGLEHELTLITAPAGYGKTTLLSEWAITLDQPVAWVSIDRRDNDPARFWGHTIAALKQAYPDFDEQPVLRHVIEDKAGDALVAALVNELNRMPQTQVIIWDDFHLLIDPVILESVVYLLERLPAHVHLYITSRVTPLLSLSRLRARNGLNLLEANDLRFNSEETTEFFVKNGAMQLSYQEAAAVQERTEGWAAAMRLAVMSLPDKADSIALVQKMTGMERDISNYFFEEVFSYQSKRMQRFLMQTSILERMTGELCRTVTGMTESEAYLQQLEQNSLFLVPLDEQQEWFRYHHLFQAFLIRQLKKSKPLEWQGFHLTAARWLEENGYLDEAIEHYLTGEDYEAALFLLEVRTPELMIQEWTTLGGWLSSIPAVLLFTKPKLLLAKIAAQYLSGRVEASNEAYWQAVRKLEEDNSSLSPKAIQTLQAGLPFLVAFRTFLDRDFEFVVQYSKEYVAKHPEGDLFVGFGNGQDGYHPVWDIYVSDDSLNLTEEVVLPLLSIWSETGQVYFIAHLHIDFGKLQYERNDLHEAERYMRKAYDIGKSYGNLSLVIIAELWLARIAAAQGDWKAANGKLQELGKQDILEANTHLSRRISLVQGTLAKMQGTKKYINQWIRTSGLRYTDEIPASMMEEYNLLAVFLAEKGQIEQATALIERLIRHANKTGRQGEQIRLLISQSRILSLQEKQAQCMDVLEEALALAWPENYIRIFVDEGAALGELLNRYIKRRQTQHHRPSKKVPLSYVKQLQRLIFPLGTETHESALVNGYKPSITRKEQSVLHLMDKGLSNKEMANELEVSLSTIKTHINNIYSKLQAKNRLQALERARTYELF